MAATSFPRLSYNLISYAVFWHTHKHLASWQLSIATTCHALFDQLQWQQSTWQQQQQLKQQTTPVDAVCCCFCSCYYIKLMHCLPTSFSPSCSSPASRLFDLHIDKATQLVKPQNEPKSDKGLWRQWVKKTEKVYIYLKLNLCTLLAVPSRANGSLNLFSVAPSPTR